MLRTILVTEVENQKTKEHEKRYGRFDIVALNNAGFSIVKSYKQRFRMDDKTFAEYGTPVEE